MVCTGTRKTEEQNHSLSVMGSLRKLLKKLTLRGALRYLLTRFKTHVSPPCNSNHVL